MGTRLGCVAITGAAGRIGSVVRAALRDDVTRLVLIDRVGLTAQSPAEDVHQLDLRDAGAVTAALKDVDAVVHLGGVPDEAPLPDLLEGMSWGRTTCWRARGGRGCGGSCSPAAIG